MKLTLVLMLLLPCFCFAQQSVPKIHFDKMVMRVNVVEDGKKKVNTVTVQDADFFPTDNTRKTECSTFKAYGVTIFESSRVLKGDKLVYYCLSRTGTLSGHVTITENGVEKKVGKDVSLDYSGAGKR